MKNWQNRFLPEDQKGVDVTCDALVDSGATELAIPAEIVTQLRVEQLDTIRVYTADGESMNIMFLEWWSWKPKAVNATSA